MQDLDGRGQGGFNGQMIEEGMQKYNGMQPPEMNGEFEDRMQGKRRMR